ncbi:MAG: hypothetical protein ACOCVA_00930 [Prolixibacteraceae bacterium]
MTIMDRKAAEFWWNRFAKEQGRKPFEVPANVHHYYKDHPQENWKVVTWQDIFSDRKKKQDQVVRFRTKYGTTQVKPAFIWIFYNDPKIFPFYVGWYVYLKTTEKDYPLNFKRSEVPSSKGEEMIQQIMLRYPYGVIPVTEHFKQWADAFERTFHRPVKKKIRNALIKCHVRTDGFGNLEDLILD